MQIGETLIIAVLVMVDLPQVRNQKEQNVFFNDRSMWKTYVIPNSLETVIVKVFPV